MQASAFEYCYRWALHAVIYGLGFWAPWTFYTTLLGSRETLWNDGMGALARMRLMSFDAAAVLLLCLGLLAVAIGTLLRVWGSAYVGSSVVHSKRMHGETLLADGIYRHTRNPLYLGTLLHTFGLALVMPLSGAIFCIVLIWMFQIRLALAEEPFLAAQFGEPYRVYSARVPRFLPAPAARVPAAGQKPQWLQSCLGEIYMLGVTVSFATLGWSFNSLMLIKGIVVSLGVSLIVRAFIPTPRTAAAEAVL